MAVGVNAEGSLYSVKASVTFKISHGNKNGGNSFRIDSLEEGMVFLCS